MNSAEGSNHSLAPDALINLGFDQVTEEIRRWVAEVLSSVTIEPGPPPSDPTGEGISLYLLNVAPIPSARSNQRPPLQVMLHYLVSTWADETLHAQWLLGEVLFAALAHPYLDVAEEALPPDLWLALDTAPRPAFILKVLLRREQAQPRVPRVEWPLVVKAHPMLVFSGRVVGPGDIPLANARVELPGFQRSTITDPDGQFELPVFNVAEGLRVLVQARGTIHETVFEQVPNDQAPVVIRIDSFD